MHPAYSVILFTTASGAGLGLLFWLALLGMWNAVPAERWLGAAGLGLSFLLVAGGLLASTSHLGRPERAWRAFSQWRTSWLSREGVMAVATTVPAAVLGVGWVLFESVGGLFAIAALLAVACTVATLYSTGMIYASLRTIRQWYQPLTAPLYVALGLASGAVLLRPLLAVFGKAAPWPAWLAIGCLVICAALKWAYWLRIDGELRTYTMEAATGLGHLGKVRVLEPPHTQPNFVMREMGYKIARKHAQKLRMAALVFAFALPIACLLLSCPAPALSARSWRRCRWRWAWPSSAGCSSPRPSTYPCCITVLTRRELVRRQWPVVSRQSIDAL
jgi:sulfite dehydrogenase (quinone) subunit SoeC